MTLPQVPLKLAASASGELAPTHGQFRAIAQHRSQQDCQLYIHDTAFEIEIPLRHIKKSPSVPFQPSIFNGKVERNLVFVCIAVIILSQQFGLAIALWPAMILFLLLMTPFPIAIQSPKYNASIKLFYDGEGRLKLNLAAPVSRDMRYPHPVTISSELNPLRLENVRVLALSVSVRQPPRLSALTFSLPANAYTSHRELTVLASRHQLQWLGQHLGQWKKLNISHFDRSWQVSC